MHEPNTVEKNLKDFTGLKYLALGAIVVFGVAWPEIGSIGPFCAALVLIGRFRAWRRGRSATILPPEAHRAWTRFLWQALFLGIAAVALGVALHEALGIPVFEHRSAPPALR